MPIDPANVKAVVNAACGEKGASNVTFEVTPISAGISAQMRGMGGNAGAAGASVTIKAIECSQGGGSSSEEPDNTKEKTTK